MNKKINYGIDAPGVILNLMVIGSLCILIFLALLIFKVMAIPYPLISTLPFAGVICLAEGGLMLRYSMFGKFKHRDKMLAMYNWKGGEKVLDIGTGRGLLLIGAAKHLTTGTAIGIDIWSAKDLSHNTEGNNIENALAEGVLNKTKVMEMDICKTSFPDNEFDVILSNLCLHNIKGKEHRKKACAEIARLLKSTGVALISDFKNNKEYTHNFMSLGLKVENTGHNYLNTFPTLTILKVTRTTP